MCVSVHVYAYTTMRCACVCIYIRLCVPVCVCACFKYVKRDYDQVCDLTLASVWKCCIRSVDARATTLSDCSVLVLFGWFAACDRSTIRVSVILLYFFSPDLFTWPTTLKRYCDCLSGCKCVYCSVRHFVDNIARNKNKKKTSKWKINRTYTVSEKKVSKNKMKTQQNIVCSKNIYLWERKKKVMRVLYMCLDVSMSRCVEILLDSQLKPHSEYYRLHAISVIVIWIWFDRWFRWGFDFVWIHFSSLLLALSRVWMFVRTVFVFFFIRLSWFTLERISHCHSTLRNCLDDHSVRIHQELGFCSAKISRHREAM